MLIEWVPANRAKFALRSHVTYWYKNCSNRISNMTEKIPFLQGYRNNVALTGIATDADGWFLTGDIGYFDDDAKLFLIDRKQDMVKHRGFLIAPSELERFIENNFDIRAVSVVGIPKDEEMYLAAAVIPGYNETSEDEITNAIAMNYSEEKHLRGGVYFVDSLPYNASGKIYRHIVQKMVIELFNARKNLYK